MLRMIRIMRKSLKLVSPSGCVLLEGREPGGLMRPCQSLNCQHIKSCIIFSCVEHLHHHQGSPEAPYMTVLTKNVIGVIGVIVISF